MTASRFLRGAFRRGAAIALAVVTPSIVRADDASSYVPRPEHDLSMLVSIVRRRVPALQTDLLAVELARADVRQARLLGNPIFDATWGTIPIGETNPAGLDAPLANVPSYTVGVSYTFPLGKRGPRLERAEALAEGAGHVADASARARALDLARVLGRIAVTRLRIDGLRGVAAQQRAVLDIARTRLTQGFGTPLDIDRLEIDVSRNEQQVLVAEAEEQAGITACAVYVGAPCRAIGSADDARALVFAWTRRAAEAAPRVANRPDVLALGAFERASIAEADLARAQAIPDPTVRVGYTHDRFVTAGNQQNSLSLTLSVPIPIFDHGLAQREAAEARRSRLALQRSLTLSTSITRVATLRELLRLQQKRQEAIEKTLPRARAMLDDLQRAANSRLLAFTDVIQARRTLDELLVEEADSYSDSFQTAVDLLAELGAP